MNKIKLLFLQYELSRDEVRGHNDQQRKVPRRDVGSVKSREQRKPKREIHRQVAHVKICFHLLAKSNGVMRTHIDIPHYSFYFL